MTVADVTFHRDGIWLTAMLRPAGELAGRAIDRFVDEVMRSLTTSREPRCYETRLRELGGIR